MKTYQIDVLEEANEKTSTRKNYILPSEPMSINELDEMLERASKSKSYSYEEAKKYLNL